MNRVLFSSARRRAGLPRGVSVGIAYMRRFEYTSTVRCISNNYAPGPSAIRIGNPKIQVDGLLVLCHTSNSSITPDGISAVVKSLKCDPDQSRDTKTFHWATSARRRACDSGTNASRTRVPPLKEYRGAATLGGCGVASAGTIRVKARPSWEIALAHGCRLGLRWTQGNARQETLNLLFSGQGVFLPPNPLRI
jgi:hypothetical protein